MTSDAGGLWPHDPEALDDNRSVDDLEIPDDDTLPDDNDTIANPLDDSFDTTDEWGDDADNRLVDLDDDESDDEDLDR